MFPVAAPIPVVAQSRGIREPILSGNKSGQLWVLYCPLLCRRASQISIDLHQMRSLNFVIFFTAFVGHSRLHDIGVAGEPGAQGTGFR
jgi:hypothetical protein